MKKRTNIARHCLLLIPVMMSVVIAVVATVTLCYGVANDNVKTVENVVMGDGVTLLCSFISIAITVWVGLNIYNVLSKEELNELVDKAAKATELVENVYTQVLISKLRLMPGERIESYLASALLKIECLPEELLRKMIALEDQFNYSYCLYKQGASGRCTEQGVELVKQLQELVESHKKALGRKQWDYLQGYLTVRGADLAFFQTQCHLSKGERIAPIRADALLEQYHTALYTFFGIRSLWPCKDPEAFSAEERQGVACIANDICAVYVALLGKDRCQKKDDALDRAIQAGKIAVEFGKEMPPHTKAVFHRNLGVAYEWKKGKGAEAFDQYYKAYQLDPQNPKVLHCIASWYRKWLCKKYPLNLGTRRLPGAMMSQRELDDAKVLLETTAYWYWLELSCGGGTMKSWPIHLQECAQDLEDQGVHLEQGLVSALKRGEFCFAELGKTARKYKEWEADKADSRKKGICVFCPLR